MHIESLLSVWNRWRKQHVEQPAMPCYRLMGFARARPDLLPYPIDMFPLLSSPSGILDSAGVLYNTATNELPAGYHPTSIAQYALAHWNAYLMNGANPHKHEFLCQASWLLRHATHFANGSSGWPIPFALPSYHVSGPWLSALAQGSGISVLTRAYQLTGDEAFLLVASRAAHSFELDILDGGVTTPIGTDGCFFEEVAAYPSAHVLSGFVLALLGLYDYVIFSRDVKIAALIQRSLKTMHILLKRFDTGYWTRYDLHHKHLASWFYHSLHVTLITALARYSDCEHCIALAERWAAYQQRPDCLARYWLISRVSAFYRDKLLTRLRRLLFGAVVPQKERICFPTTDFPIAGGIGRVLASVSQVMARHWHMTYLAQQTVPIRTTSVGASFSSPPPPPCHITTFGNTKTHPWQFPTVWLYALAGGCKLFSLLSRGAAYGLILPQDGVFTGAFAALIGRLAGARVVCMDHGHVAWLDNLVIHRERIERLRGYPWHWHSLARVRYWLYWPSLRLLAALATRCTDQFLVAGDEVAQVYSERFGVPPERITRYAYAVDVERFAPPDSNTRLRQRLAQGLSEDALVITLINRLTSEKGLPFALRGISLALSVLPPDVRARVNVLIAGDGPLRERVKADIWHYGLDAECVLLGPAEPSDVARLLSITDIFLYSGTRGTDYSMAVLEAMAVGCAVIASTAPQSNAQLLADGRGILVPPGDAAAIATSLVELCSNEQLRTRMGHLARHYVAQHHNPALLKRSLLHATYFTPQLNPVVLCQPSIDGSPFR
jgi:glycosyltransferase involved in cell wall biosynthesis